MLVALMAVPVELGGCLRLWVVCYIGCFLVWWLFVLLFLLIVC